MCFCQQQVIRVYSLPDGTFSSDEDEEEDDDDDEEDVVTKTMEQIPESGTATYMVISAFKGEQEGDLTIQVKILLRQIH